MVVCLFLLSVVELRKPRKESHCFLERVEEYLKSDVYMYAPLLNSPPHSPRGTHSSYKYFFTVCVLEFLPSLEYSDDLL